MVAARFEPLQGAQCCGSVKCRDFVGVCEHLTFTLLNSDQSQLSSVFMSGQMLPSGTV